MMTTNIFCNRQLLNTFLSTDLSGEDARQLEDHLEACPECRAALGRGAADSDFWSHAKRFLQDDADDLYPLGKVFSEIARTDEYQRLIEALGASDDPRMLGRLGSYEIAGIVGAGGMGMVLKAFDPALARFVAIKVLTPRLWRDEEARERFSREARSVAAVVHDNIVEVYGVFEASDIPYFTMPYLRGETLQQRIEQRGPLSVPEILSISRQLASGLAAAHAQGLVHRDIKPANIFLAEGAERVLITDFGLAKSARDDRLTQSDVIAGTPAFMSPEQVKGQTLDHRSDLFSLAGVMYMMASGRPPFVGKSPFEMFQHVCEARPDRLETVAPATPAWLAAIIDRLHHASPEERYQSAGELASDLEECLAHENSPRVYQRPRHIDRLQTRYERSARSGRLHRLTIAVVLVALATVFGASRWLGLFDPSGDTSQAAGTPAVQPATSTVDVSGQVVDEQGQPLPDTNVLAVQKLWPNGRYQQRSKQTKTDEEGKFVFENFATRGEQYAFLLTALPEQHAMVSEYRVVSDGTPQPPVILKTSTTPETVIALKDKSGEPVVGAQIMPGTRMTVDGKEHITYAMQVSDGGKPTDKDGRLALHAFLPGESGSLTIDIGGHVTEHKIDVSKDAPAEILVVADAATSEGKSVSVTGKLVDAQDRPLAEKTIYIVRKTWLHSRYRQEGLTVKTGENGGFTLSDFAPEGRPYAFLLTAIVDGYLMKSEYRFLEDGAQQDAVTLKLTPAEPVTFTLTDRQGHAVEGAQLAPHSRTAEDADAIHYHLNAEASARSTNKDGQVQFTAWAPGEAGHIFCEHDKTYDLEFTVPESREVKLMLTE